MTVLVGILCKDGVVIGSDSSATFGSNGQMTIGQQTVQKVTIIQGKIAHAGTGAVGMSQLVVDTINRAWTERVFSGMKTPEAAMNEIGKRIGAVVAPYLQTAQMQRHITGEASSTLCKSLIAVPVNHKFQLFQFDFNGAPEMATTQLPFVALGSGQAIADPFLALLKRLLWPSAEPTLAEGRLAAVWTIDHVRRTNPGGVGGAIQLATLGNANGFYPVSGSTPILRTLSLRPILGQRSVHVEAQALQPGVQARARRAGPAIEIELPPDRPGGWGQPEHAHPLGT